MFFFFDKLGISTYINRGIYPMQKRLGFTLIELLVVVLIIGILSAVALPQYTKAVEKSRAAEAISVLNALYRQYQLCYLYGDQQNCDMGESFDDYDVPPPGTKLSNGCYKTKDWYYCPPTQSDIIAYRVTSASSDTSPWRNAAGSLTMWGYGWGANGDNCLGTISCNNGDDTGFCKKIGFTATRRDCDGTVQP